MPTPNLYADALQDPFEHVPTALQTNPLEVLYATDRVPENVEEGPLVYGSMRSMSWAFGISRVTLGKEVSWEELTERQRELAEALTNLNIIDAQVKGNDFYSHSYFYTNPAVSSDLILLLRYDLAPGSENGRPLEWEGANFWALTDSYPGSTYKKSLAGDGGRTKVEEGSIVRESGR